MKTITSLIVAGLTWAGLTQVFAQPNGPNYAWLRHLPDVDGAKAAAMDGLGHVYVAGIFSKTNTIGTNTLIPASTTTESVFLAKYDSAGNVLWARHAGDTGTSGVDSPYVALAVDSAGNAYLTSEFTRSNIVIGSFTLTNSSVAGTSDMYVAKFNSAGDVQWARKSQGTGSEYGSAAGVDSQGNCYIGGHYTTAPDLTFDGVPLFVTTPNSGIFVVKYNASGQVQWVRNGATGSWLYCYGMAVDGTGNCFITGQAGGATDFGSTNLPSGVHFYLIKYASAGVIEWVKTNTVGTAEGHAVAVGPDGSVHVAGEYWNSVGFVGGVAQLTESFHSMFVAKWDVNGVFQWAQGPGGTTRSEANAIAVDGRTNCYVTGTFNGPLQFGSASVNDTGNADFYLTKLNNAGQFQWVQIGGGNGSDEGWGVVVDPFGYVYADLTMSFGAGTFGTFTLTGISQNDFVLAKLDSGQAPTPLTLDIAMYAGLKIQGQVGGQVQVQCVNAVGDTNNWLPMATFPFTNSPYIFIDYDSPTQPKRFYRALQLP